MRVDRRIGVKLLKYVLLIFGGLPLFLLAFLLFGVKANGQTLDEKLAAPFPFASSAIGVDRLVSEFSRRNALPIQLAEGFEGSVSIRNKHGSNRDFLNQLSARINATWWHNDVIVFVEPLGSIKSQNFDLGEVPFDLMMNELKTMGLKRDNYSVVPTQIGSLVRVSGPVEYLKNFKSFIADVKRAYAPEVTPVASADNQPKIYFGQIPVGSTDVVE